MDTPTAGGPPWILGARGASRLAPENTRAALELALALGLDGNAFELEASRDGELALHGQATLERLGGGAAALGERPWRELAELDAGAWFHARFRGARLVLAEEALALARPDGAAALALAIVERESRGLAAELARAAHAQDRAQDRAQGRTPALRVASSARDVLLEARAEGLATCAIAAALDARVRERLEQDRPDALAAPLPDWLGPAGREAWPCERWSLALDLPGELLAGLRAGLTGFTTHEPARALAARALVRLAPHAQDWPVAAPRLEIEPGTRRGEAGEWCGRWSLAARVENPFGFRVRAEAALAVRRGAFDVGGLPASFELEPGASRAIEFTLAGGSWQPGGDPLLAVRFAWRAGPGREAGGLVLDAPLVRVRSAWADAVPRRLELLREARGDGPASLVLHRRGPWIHVVREGSAGLADPRVVVLLGRELKSGVRGVRARLPAGFDTGVEGVPFSCGLSAWREGERVWRRWAGGLSDDPDPGEPGRLLPLARG